jgi:endonuclease/exonuclease/phosphatase (EEP) superfamily protein YafD
MLTGLALVATLVSLLPARLWFLELLASFRVQITTLCVLSAALAFLFRMRIWGTVGATLAIVQIGLLVPFFVSAQKETEHLAHGRSLTILTANVECTNRRGEEVLEMIRSAGADIVALQEIDPWWAERIDTLEEYPYRLIDRSTSKPAVALLSRVAPAEEVWAPLFGRLMITARFPMERGDISIAVLHTYPPRTPFLYDLRNRQIDLAAKRARREKGPFILAGDLNATPWSPVVRDFEETTGLWSVRNGKSPLPTWPSWNVLMQVPIDHIYHSGFLLREKVERVPIPGSDHVGLLARLNLP